MNTEFTFIILTLNEEIHLERLLNSISGLNATTYVLDSGSTDRTLAICENRKITCVYAPFINHPEQWHIALQQFKIITPWIIALDADQTLSSELYSLLSNFDDQKNKNIDGIYFNRKNYFKNQWIRHGGYFPMYMLKMFRTDKGFSDLSGKMDHRFLVVGKTVIWEDGYLLEENLKENNISFWISKHNTYSDLLAQEEYEGRNQIKKINILGGITGSPNEQKIWKKQLWQIMPLFVRPFLYFFFRLIIQRGILDGKTGILFHFLQGFWFRIIVDIKIKEIEGQNRKDKVIRNSSPSRFLFRFLFLFTCFYYFNIVFIGLSVSEGYHLPTLENHLNYIEYFRKSYISNAAWILTQMGYEVTKSDTGLNVIEHAGFRIVYSCLGYGIISCFTAFAITFPKPVKYRYLFIGLGVCGIVALNTCRLILIAIYYKSGFSIIGLNHHDLYNILVYVTISVYAYLWLNAQANVR